MVPTLIMPQPGSAIFGKPSLLFYTFLERTTHAQIHDAGRTELYYKDWGSGAAIPVVFCHGWPLSSDAWESQMLHLAEHGFRCIAHDRRGHGRSSQPWTGNHMDQYADDLAELLNHLSVQNAILVGHSTGGGEVARYIGRHGTARVAKAVLMGAVTPLMLKTEANPMVCPKKCLMDSVQHPSRTDHSFTKNWLAALSLASIGKVRPNHKG